MFIKNPTEFWDGVGLFTLSGVLDNFQLDNYFLPVKMVPLQLQLARVFIYLFFPTCTRICCETGDDFKMSKATCSFWDEFLQSLLPWKSLLGSRNLQFLCCIITTSASLLVNFLEFWGQHIYHFLISKSSRLIGGGISTIFLKLSCFVILLHYMHMYLFTILQLSS